MNGPMFRRTTPDPDRRRIGAHASFYASERVLQRAFEAVGQPDRLQPEFVDTLPADEHDATAAVERLNQALDRQFGEILNVSIGK